MARDGQGDDELIRAFRGGSAEAFETLFARHRDRAYFYALGLTGSPGLAEEAVQAAFLGFLRRLEAYRPEGAFAGYLLAAVRSRAIDAMRREGRREAREEALEALFAPPPGPEEEYAAKEHRLLVARALYGLPQGQRAAVLLRIWEGLGFAEIAALAGVGTNTAASRFRRGIARLRRVLARRMCNG